MSDALDSKASGTDLTAHTTSKTNPHVVTKAQVGLGSVDNTTDAGKPVSTATQTALDMKFDKTGGTISGRTILNGNYDGVRYASDNIDVDANVRGSVYTSISTDTKGKHLGREYIHLDENGQLAKQQMLIHGAHSRWFTHVVTANGEAYMTTPMRASPGTLDIVNKGYLDTRLNAMMSIMTDAMTSPEPKVVLQDGLRQMQADAEESVQLSVIETEGLDMPEDKPDSPFTGMR